MRNNCLSSRPSPNGTAPHGAAAGKTPRASKWLVLALVLVGFLAMALVESVLRPPYAVKSLLKLLLFSACILLYARGNPDFWSCYRLPKKPLAALALGVLVFAFLLAAYALLGRFFDFSRITASLLEKEHINRQNFIFVALYISLVNSFLEESFFRGLAFLALRRHIRPLLASLFSALSFAFYHIFIMANWFTPALFLLLLAGLSAAGLLFNFLDRKGSLYPSWLVHLSANLAINCIALSLF